MVVLLGAVITAVRTLIALVANTSKRKLHCFQRIGVIPRNRTNRLRKAGDENDAPQLATKAFWKRKWPRPARSPDNAVCYRRPVAFFRHDSIEITEPQRPRFAGA
jgi:hypothetical protein